MRRFKPKSVSFIKKKFNWESKKILDSFDIFLSKGSHGMVFASNLYPNLIIKTTKLEGEYPKREIKNHIKAYNTIEKYVFLCL